jgi:hypothetical protein
VKVRYTRDRGARPPRRPRRDHEARSTTPARTRSIAIQPTILRENRARVEGATEDLAPLAALGLWMDANDVAEREPLTELTTTYLEGTAA